jgi:hypothetical protein
MDCFVDLIEALDREQAFLNLVNPDGSYENLIQIKIPDLTASIDHVGALAMGADDAAAVYFDFSILQNQPKFNRVPK